VKWVIQFGCIAWVTGQDLSTFVNTFYRDSADYAKKDVCLFVCLSVRPSVTRWYSVETVTHILKRF